MELWLIVILGIVFMWWAITTYLGRCNNSEQIFLTELSREADVITGIAGYDKVQYELKVTHDRTRVVDKRIIYLVTHRVDKSLYSKNSLLTALLHEIAHVVAKSQNHTKEFRSIEAKLKSASNVLGYTFKLDHDYPCNI